MLSLPLTTETNPTWYADLLLCLWWERPGRGGHRVLIRLSWRWVTMASGPGLREWVLCLRFPVGMGRLRFPFFYSQGLHLTVPVKGPTSSQHRERHQWTVNVILRKSRPCLGISNSSTCALIISCVWLCDPLDPATLLCPWDFPARILEWDAISSFRASCQPRDWTQYISCIGRQILYQCHLGSPILVM